MITRVPVSISMGTRGTRELLMSLLVEALTTHVLARIPSLTQFSPQINARFRAKLTGSFRGSHNRWHFVKRSLRYEVRVSHLWSGE